MSQPWTPTPEGSIPDPPGLLGLFADAPPGNITAQDQRDLVQALSSASHWQAARIDQLEIQVADLGQVASGLITDTTALQTSMAAAEADVVALTARVAALEAGP